MVSMSVTEARASLPELLDRVVGGEEITITRHGNPVAVVVRPDVLRSRRPRAAFADAERVHELLTTARAIPLPRPGGVSPQRAEELIREVRAGRTTR